MAGVWYEKMCESKLMAGVWYGKMSEFGSSELLD